MVRYKAPLQRQVSGRHDTTPAQRRWVRQWIEGLLLPLPTGAADAKTGGSGDADVLRDVRHGTFLCGQMSSRLDGEGTRRQGMYNRIEGKVLRLPRVLSR
jgi:hypothetical protein